MISKTLRAAKAAHAAIASVSVPDLLINKRGKINVIRNNPDVKALHTSDLDLWHLDWSSFQ